MSRSGRHPPGLYVCFFTEMWERFSFYGMMALLVLYMDEHLHFSHNRTAQIYGLYTAFIYFTPLAGGWLADKVIGFRKAIIIGGILMGLGHFSLAFDHIFFFFTGLVLLICGGGMLKPNISTLLGNLYNDQPELKDVAYNIFYMGINIGATMAPVVMEQMHRRFGWHAAFGTAGVGMGIGLAIFVGFGRYFAGADQPSERSAPEPSDHGITAHVERDRIFALLIVFGIVVLFWMAYMQDFFTLTLWARDATRTRHAPEFFNFFNGLFIILFTPLLVGFWRILRQRGAEPSTPMKLVIGMLLTALGFAILVTAAKAGGDHGRVSSSWLISTYAVVAVAELCLSPIGLSLVSKLAPRRLRARFMGGWFAAYGLGNYLSGVVGTLWFRMQHSSFFLLLVFSSLLAALLLFTAIGKLRRTMHGVA